VRFLFRAATGSGQISGKHDRMECATPGRVQRPSIERPGFSLRGGQLCIPGRRIIHLGVRAGATGAIFVTSMPASR